MVYKFSGFFSMENPKAIKAKDYGYLNAINYMAPAELGGVGNLCPNSSAGCRNLCLGWYAGHANIGAENPVRRSRRLKAEMFMRDRQQFLMTIVQGIMKAQRKAKREGFKLCVRLNGSSDIKWEGIKIPFTLPALNIFDAFPDIQFVDYTKIKRRMLDFCAGRLPPNYHLTFSRSEDNQDDCETVLANGGNVAVVFAGKMHELPDTYLGYRVIDGDNHDLRHLDTIDEDGNERGAVIVGLIPKGPAARRDTSGFVVRL